MALPHVLTIVAPRGYREEELFGPLEAWRGRLRVTATSTRRGTARGMASVAYPIEASLADLFDSVFDAIVVVGGDGAPEHLWDNSSVLGTLRRHLAGGSLICAICFGVVALARAGVLAGRRATVYPDRRAELEIARGGAILAADPLVADGNVLTARGPSDAGLLAQTILARLGA